MRKWIKSGWDYFDAKQSMVKKSFLVCGITNALYESENQFNRCLKELPELQLPYVDESTDDVFLSGGESSGDDEGSSTDDD